MSGARLGAEGEEGERALAGVAGSPKQSRKKMLLPPRRWGYQS